MSEHGFEGGTLPVTAFDRKTGKKNVRETIDIQSGNRLSASVEKRVSKKSTSALEKDVGRRRRSKDRSTVKGATQIEGQLDSGARAALIKRRRK